MLQTAAIQDAGSNRTGSLYHDKSCEKYLNRLLIRFNEEYVSFGGRDIGEWAHRHNKCLCQTGALSRAHLGISLPPRTHAHTHGAQRGWETELGDEDGDADELVRARSSCCSPRPKFCSTW